MDELLDAVYNLEPSTELADIIEPAPAETEAAPEAETSPDVYPEAYADEPVAEPAPAPLTRELEIDGTTRTVTAEEAFTQYQKSLAAEKRFQEAAEARKAFEAEKAEFLRAMQSDPAKQLEAAGIDPVEWARKVTERKLQEELLDPEDLAVIRREEEREQALAEVKKMQEERYQAEVAKHSQRIGQELKEAFDSADIPITPITAFMAVKMLDQASAANTPMTPAQAVAQVNTLTAHTLQTALDRLSDDNIEKFLGDKTIERLQKRLASKVKNKYSRAKTTAPVTPTKATAKGKEYHSFDDFLKDLQES